MSWGMSLGSFSVVMALSVGGWPTFGLMSAKVASVAPATPDAARFMDREFARDKGHGRMQMKRWARWLQRLRPFGIGARSSGRLRARPEGGRGCSSGVEHDLAKVGVEGSNPFARSKNSPNPAAQFSVRATLRFPQRMMYARFL